MKRWTVLIADDHAILREGLQMLLRIQPDLEVVGEASGGIEAVRMARDLAPDVVILDVSMPDLAGPDAAKQIISDHPETGIVALTRHADPGYMRRMVAAGARGYVLKRTAGDILMDAIRTVARGGSHVDPTVAGAAMVRNMNGKALPGVSDRQGVLSEREEQTLKHIAWGRSNKEVAHHLGISVKTVEFYRASAVEKLGLRTRSDIVRHALNHNWLDPEEEPT